MSRRRLRRLFHLDRFGRRLEESLDEEVRFHLQTRIDGFVRAGLSEDKAREKALKQFGDPDLVVQRCRRIDERSAKRKATSELARDIRQDVRFAIRTLIKARGFTFVSVLSLACGIGVFTAFFALFDATYLKPIPGMPEGDRVTELLTVRRGAEYEVWAYPDFLDLRTASTPFQDLAGWKDRTGTLTTGNGGELVNLMYVSANYFRVLGVVPIRGRAFLDSEDVAPGQHQVAVVSHDMWQTRLDGDPEIVGRTVTLNRLPYLVVGVAPEAFKGHRALRDGEDFWLPLMQDPWVAGGEGWVGDRDSSWLRVLGRLRDGATLGEANASLGTVFARLEEQHPDTNDGRRARAYSVGPIPASGRAQSFLAVSLAFALMAAVLLIICGNVAGMVLARSVTRDQEIAIRLALGSGRGGLVRLLLVEAFVLAMAGGVLGLLLGVWGLDTAYAAIPGFPEIAFGFNGPVVGFTFLVTVGATMAVGLVPALRFSRPELVSSLKDDSGGGSRRAGRIHRYSASAQVGLALTLLVTSSLFLRALGVMERRDLGFQPDGLYTTRIDLSQEGLESQELAEPFLDRVRDELGAQPGVTSLSITDGIPVDLSGNFTSVSRGDQTEPATGRVQVEFTKAGEGFFETIGTPILRGRGFEATDDSSSELVMVITESLSTRLWPGEEALGRRVWSGMSMEGPRLFTVVGVVPDVASSRPTENWHNIFVPYRQNFVSRIMVAIRGQGDASALSRVIQSTLLEIEPNLPVPSIVTSESLVTRSTGSQLMSAQWAGGLGLLALLLSAIGVYGVVAFAVTSRTREIGLRMAMGATRGDVLRGVLKDAVRLAVPGLLIGALLAIGTALAFRSQFFGLSPVDPVSFGFAGVVLLMVILVASIAPARRASGIDPMKALRME